MAGVTTLRARRIAHCDAFASRCSESQRFAHWFPRRSTARITRAAGVSEPFFETFARCNRLRDLPLHYFRRWLNGKEGKKYGERYCEYRED